MYFFVKKKCLLFCFWLLKRHLHVDFLFSPLHCQFWPFHIDIQFNVRYCFTFDGSSWHIWRFLQAQRTGSDTVLFICIITFHSNSSSRFTGLWTILAQGGCCLCQQHQIYFQINTTFKQQQQNNKKKWKFWNHIRFWILLRVKRQFTWWFFVCFTTLSTWTLSYECSIQIHI